MAPRLVPTAAHPINIRQALRIAIADLQAAEVPSAELAAELLLMHVLGRDRAYLYTNPEINLAPEAAERYFTLVAERATGKPTQYITGRQEFWGLDFEVTPDVLIPRPETEHLVETVLELARADDRGGAGLRIADAGTGSGCVALALASELPRAFIYGIDISWPALQVAGRNARRLGLDDRVGFVQADLLSPLTGVSLDFVVSNPPYVGGDEVDRVQREVREWEPRVAWGGTGRGDEIYVRLFAQAAKALRPQGQVVVEVGYSQAEIVTELLGTGWSGVGVRPDLAGIPRVVTGRKNPE
ncbi:MAG TPA: peptide chain release factor N(5)-glutamine methyltransferase [Terriglobia bacterium]|nr:peptide chain release factor N(5)-glutamine methyltransferase [Terriglobia bacterium]